MARNAPSDIRAAVLAQRSSISGLLDTLRADNPDPAGPGVCRDTYGPGEQRGHARVAAFADEMGLERKGDHAANMYMTLPGLDRTRPALMTGSHMDSVPNGGNYDGAAGVLAGLVMQRALIDLGLEPACDVTTMAIRAEESVWFEVSYIGSRAAFGVLPDGALDARRIDTGRPLAEHMAECGADIAAIKARTAALDARKIAAWVEVHIEQAPQLVEAGIAVAIGTGVPGNFRYPNVRILGEHAHVGLPRRFRQDCVMAGSDFALGLDTIWQAEEAAGRPMAFCIGRFHTNPAEHALTKVAGEMGFSLDVRAYDAGRLADLERRVLGLVKEIEAERGVRFELGARTSADGAPSDPPVMRGLGEAAARLGIRTQPLASPASHDTATFATAGVPTAMLFVRNTNGSHNPAEAMEIDDFLEAACILTQWAVNETEAR